MRIAVLHLKMALNFTPLEMPLTRSFIRRWVIVLLVTLIPLTLLAGLEFFSAPLEPRAEAKRLELELDRLLQIRLHETFTLAALPSLRAFSASTVTDRTARAAVALNELQAWVSADTPVREAFIVDRAGVTILGTGKDWNRDWSSRVFVKQALAGQLDVSPPSLDQGEFSQYYAAPILDNRGEVAGALIARIDAQELWDLINAASIQKTYAVLVDEAGVRLADGSNAARNLRALAPLNGTQQTQVLDEQTYGAQITVVRADTFRRAADMLAARMPDLIRPEDLGVQSLSAQGLTTKPWTVLILRPVPALQIRSYLLWPIVAATICAGLGAWLLRR